MSWVRFSRTAGLAGPSYRSPDSAACGPRSPTGEHRLGRRLEKRASGRRRTRKQKISYKTDRSDIVFVCVNKKILILSVYASMRIDVWALVCNCISGSGVVKVRRLEVKMR